MKTRSAVLKLKHLSRSTCCSQNALSYLTLTVSNNLPTRLKLSNILNRFKHDVKEQFFKNLKNKEQDIFAYSLICGALRDLVRFAQFKKREKHPWRSITFSKVAGWSLQLY